MVGLSVRELKIMESLLYFENIARNVMFKIVRSMRRSSTINDPICVTHGKAEVE
jgi:hypothetical protein